MLNLYRSLAIFLSLLTTLSVSAQTPDSPKPRVRAVTGFVRLDRAHFDEQINETLTVLRAAKQEFENRGYEVSTVRIVTQPLGELIQGQSEADALALLQHFDELSVQEKFVPNVGPAMLKDSDDPRTMQVLAKALAALPNLHGNAIIAAEDGIHWKVIRQTAQLLRYVTDHSKSAESHGNLDFTATAMLKPFAPFYPGAYHTSDGKRFSIGFESANVVQQVFTRTRGDFANAVSELTKALTVHAKVAEAIGEQIAAAHQWMYMGMDPTPAPRPDASIGTAIESFTGAPFGSSGTMTAALIITTAVKAVPVKQIGYSGLMMPVMEDSTLSKQWADGKVTTDMLLAYSAVCGTGLDTIPYPGDISEEQLARILGDVASLAWKWNKPLSARLLPFKGLKTGDQTHFTGRFLSNTTLRVLP